MQTLWQDIRYGSRMLLKKPSFTAIAIITIALGIGANTAIFSLVNTVLFRPFPVKNSQELYTLSVQIKDGSFATFSYPDFIDFQNRNEVLAGLYATRIAPMSVSNNGNNERLWGYLVSGNYFDLLGVQPIRGRFFTPDEDRVRNANPVAVISYSCWQKRFGGSSDIVDKDVIINGHSYKIIGVAPEGFSGTELIFSPDLWVPMCMQEWIEPGSHWLDSRSAHNIFVTGRLKPDISRGQAEASLNIVAQQLGREYPDDDEGLSIQLVKPGFILPNVRGAFVSFSIILLAVVALVLLIACTNLASLMLARATRRRKEIAVRLSLGASRTRLIRQLLTESLLLSFIGGVAGLLLAVWLIDLIIALKPPLDIPLTIELHLDWRVLVFSISVSVITSVLFGLIPALQATKPDIVSSLKDETTIGGHHRTRLRSGLVIAQLALSLVLLIAAGLVLHALLQLQTMNPGFEVKNGLVMNFDLSLQGYDNERGKQFQKQLIEHLKTVPGGRSAALTDLMPLSINYSSNGIFVEGQEPVRGADIPNAMVASVSTDYFTAMSIPVLAGRAFAEQDNDKAPQVAVVNEAFVRRFFPETKSLDNAIGKRFSFRSQGPFIQIAGVVQNGKYWSIGETPQPFVYSPLQQSYSGYTTLIIRTEGNPKALTAAVRNEFRKLDENLPVFNVKTLEEHLGIALFPARVAASLLGSFGMLALILAAIGIYGVMAYSVAQRTREIGIRMALGAQGKTILRMILKQGAVMALIGLGIGLICALVLTQMMSSLLYGVSATDPITFIVVPLILTGVALTASFVPALRAAKTDPMVALRYE